MKIPMNAIADVIEGLLRNPKAIKAIKYLSDKQVVRAVRKAPSGGNIYISLMIGHPNYAERDFIRGMKRIKNFPPKFIIPYIKNPKKKTPSRK